MNNLEFDVELLSKSIIYDRWKFVRFVASMSAFLILVYAIAAFMVFKTNPTQSFVLSFSLLPILGATGWQVWNSFMDRKWKNRWRLFPSPIVYISPGDNDTRAWIQENIDPDNVYVVTSSYIFKNKADAVAVKLMRPNYARVV
jgi:ABC-type multidrug transport system permease subunit